MYTHNTAVKDPGCFGGFGGVFSTESILRVELLLCEPDVSSTLEQQQFSKTKVR